MMSLELNALFLNIVIMTTIMRKKMAINSPATTE
jgi:hypothetical protein